MRRSPGPMGCPASSMNSTASASAMDPYTSMLSRSPRTLRGLWRPGVSTRTNWVSPFVATPRMVFLVVWGRGDVIATFSPTSALTSVDFPTLGRPTTETNPEVVIAAPPERGLPADLGLPQRSQRYLHIRTPLR